LADTPASKERCNASLTKESESAVILLLADFSHDRSSVYMPDTLIPAVTWLVIAVEEGGSASISLCLHGK